MQIAKDVAVFPDNEPFVFQLVAKRIVHSEQQLEQDNPQVIRFLYTMITMQCTLFLVVFSFFEKKYLLLSCATSVCPSVEIISFRGNSLSNWPIKLIIGLSVREGVVHVRKA